MSPSNLPSACRTHQPRKRTKTFTGCWSCRARKIKCDEGKPTCQQCRDRKVTCNGYGSRLQWLTPETVDSSGRIISVCSDASIPQTSRREIPPEPPKTTLSWGRLEEILRSIDAVEPKAQANSDSAVSTVIQNFGVFNVELRSPGRPVVSPGRSCDGNAHPTSYQTQDGDDDLARLLIPTSFPDTFVSSTSVEDAAVAWDLCNLQYGQPSLRAPNETDASLSPDIEIETSLLVLTDQSHTWIDSLDSCFDAQASVTDEIADENTSCTSWRIDYPNPLCSLEPFVVPVQERILMDHYKTRVVNLFCVIDNDKSPWKTIHLPRVLQCVGELSSGGSTTKIRNALRYALYSISAFVLSNVHKSAMREDEARKWFNAASQYRYDAIGLLTSAVENDLYGNHRPRYKEFLATMLSMISINVMSADTSTCAVHLNGVEQLIRHMRTRKSKFSRKAQSLHRIYLYLRVIYESTASRSKELPKPRLSGLLGSLGTTGRQPALAFTEASVSSNPGIEEQDSRDQTATYEYIYGIPQALLLMLKETIEVIDMVDDEREAGNVEVSESLAATCERLESKILDWHVVHRGQDTNSTTNGNTNARIIHHQTKAFHNALIVYFSQHVRLLGYRYLRQYVNEVLESIEAMEKIKAETNILAAPLFWPAFIGATEAFEPAMQERFRKWYDAASLYGVAAVRTGIEVIHKVWEQGPSSGRRSKSSWRVILDEGQQVLMLT